MAVAYRCSNCGYEGAELVYQFNDYTYCLASNDEEPEYIGPSPSWIPALAGDAEIREPVGCPRCHARGVVNFDPV